MEYFVVGLIAFLLGISAAVFGYSVKRLHKDSHEDTEETR